MYNYSVCNVIPSVLVLVHVHAITNTILGYLHLLINT